jgi:NAD kinase
MDIITALDQAILSLQQTRTRIISELQTHNNSSTIFSSSSSHEITSSRISVSPSPSITPVVTGDILPMMNNNSTVTTNNSNTSDLPHPKKLKSSSPPLTSTGNNNNTNTTLPHLRIENLTNIFPNNNLLPLSSPSLHVPTALERLRSSGRLSGSATPPATSTNNNSTATTTTTNGIISDTNSDDSSTTTTTTKSSLPPLATYHSITSATSSFFPTTSTSTTSTTTTTDTPQPTRSRFHLVAYSGDTRELIAPPPTNIITVPPLAKSFIALVWQERPKTALVIRKPGDVETRKIFIQACEWLRSEGIRVVVETDSRNELGTITEGEIFHTSHSQVHKTNVDFVVALGGDGTFIRAAHAFPNGCPPVIAFALGTLGFLTPFPVNSLHDGLTSVVKGGFQVRLRARLEFEVHRQQKNSSNNNITETVCVLNEAVIDRGHSSSVTKLILFSNQGDEPLTTAMGDGLIVSTPTGSTAYSLSAGGSMVHPSVPAILVTPICPHSLSFRPILIPDSATLRIKVASDARNSAWISFDGRPSLELQPGDWVNCRYSQFPVPAVMAFRPDDSNMSLPGASSDEWLLSLRTALHWNNSGLTGKSSAL